MQQRALPFIAAIFFDTFEVVLKRTPFGPAITPVSATRNKSDSGGKDCGPMGGSL